MKSVKILISLFTLFSALTLIGCAKGRNDEKQNDTILKAYRLIDEQRTDEAIELLEIESSRDPKNQEIKTVLASAYAHKAGIKIQKLVPVVVQIENLKKLQETKPAKEPAPPERDKQAPTQSQQVNEGALQIAKLLNQLSGTFQVYAAIPLINKNQATYLVHAVQLMQDLGPNTAPENAVYRAVLRIVLLKYYLAEGFIGELSEPEIRSEQTCRLNLGALNDSLIKLGKILIDIYNDIGYANPRQASAMSKLATETADGVSKLTIATTTVTALDEAANIFLKQTAILNGFGKMIKCGGN